MNEWCIEHHGKSGLTQMCRESSLDTAAAEAQVLPACSGAWFAAIAVPIVCSCLSCTQLYIEEMLHAVSGLLQLYMWLQAQSC